MPQPVIGITTGSIARGGNTSTMISQLYDAIPQAFGRSVETAGGLPLLIPTLGNSGNATELLGRIDGLLLAGGDDVNPLAVSQEPRPGIRDIDPERDEAELALARAAFGSDIPILGICRGIQVLVLALGGDIYQDLKEYGEKTLSHDQRAPRWCATHSVELEKGSRLEEISGNAIIETNTFHHQAVSRVPDGFQITGRTADGMIEAVECPEKRFVIGVQWHAEHMTERHEHARSLFRVFVESAAGKKT